MDVFVCFWDVDGHDCIRCSSELANYWILLDGSTWRYAREPRSISDYGVPTVVVEPPIDDVHFLTQTQSIERYGILDSVYSLESTDFQCYATEVLYNDNGYTSRE